MKKTILEMTKKEVQLERWELERLGYIADASWYLSDLLESLKKKEAIKNVI